MSQSKTTNAEQPAKSQATKVAKTKESMTYEATRAKEVKETRNPRSATAQNTQHLKSQEPKATEVKSQETIYLEQGKQEARIDLAMMSCRQLV